MYGTGQWDLRRCKSYECLGLLLPFLLLLLLTISTYTTMRLSTSSYPLGLAAGLAAVTIESARATAWSLSETYGPNDFFNGFDWFTATDPTNGLVLYQSMADAKADNISVVQNDQFVMAVDTTEVALEGRKSVRISSSKGYNDGIYVWVLKRLSGNAGKLTSSFFFLSFFPLPASTLPTSPLGAQYGLLSGQSHLI